MLDILGEILTIDTMTIYKIHPALVNAEKICRLSLPQRRFGKYRFGSIAQKSEYKNNMYDQRGGKYASSQQPGFFCCTRKTHHALIQICQIL